VNRNCISNRKVPVLSPGRDTLEKLGCLAKIAQNKNGRLEKRPFEYPSAIHDSDVFSGVDLGGSTFFSVSGSESVDFEVRLKEPEEER